MLDIVALHFAVIWDGDGIGDDENSVSSTHTFSL